MIQGHCLVGCPDSLARRRSPVKRQLPQRRPCRREACLSRLPCAATRRGRDADTCLFRSSQQCRRDHPERDRRRSQCDGAAGSRGSIGRPPLPPPRGAVAVETSLQDGSDVEGSTTAVEWTWAAVRRTLSRAAARTRSSPSRGYVRWEFSLCSGTVSPRRTAAMWSCRLRLQAQACAAMPGACAAMPPTHLQTAAYTTYNTPAQPTSVSRPHGPSTQSGIV